MSLLEKDLPPLLEGNREALRKALSAALDQLDTGNIEHSRLILFGSWVTATANQHSDIDLCLVLGGKSCQAASFDSARYSLAIKRLPYDFDVIVTDEHSLENDFVSPILNEVRRKGKTV